jgi:hypothetical protein
MGSDDFSLTASTAQRSIDQRDKASVKKLTLPSLHVLYSLMMGNKPKSTRGRNEKVVSSDSPTLRVEYRPSSRHLQQSP